MSFSETESAVEAVGAVSRPAAISTASHAFVADGGGSAYGTFAAAMREAGAGLSGSGFLGGHASLAGARGALAGAKPVEALHHLHAAVAELRALSEALQAQAAGEGHRLDPATQRQMERQLLQLRQEIRNANRLTEQGLAFCQDWTAMLLPMAEGYGSASYGAASYGVGSYGVGSYGVGSAGVESAVVEGAAVENLPPGGREAASSPTAIQAESTGAAYGPPTGTPRLPEGRALEHLDRRHLEPGYLEQEQERRNG